VGGVFLSEEHDVVGPESLSDILQVKIIFILIIEECIKTTQRNILVEVGLEESNDVLYTDVVFIEYFLDFIKI
jgi:hypothetical protein